MAKKGPSSQWIGRRGTALVLALALCGLGVHDCRTGVRDLRILSLIFSGVILGLVYAFNGGILPRWILEVARSPFLGGGSINSDDDPSNLSPKVYLPVLAIVVATAFLIYYFYGPRR